MLGRPLVADPAWPKKAREARRDQIRLCVSCNTCWAVINTGAGIRCDANPRLATPAEADWTPTAAAKKRRIVVIGAGLAGMEAAWVAAARGHEVTVLSASSETGGKARLHAQLPGGRGVENIFTYQRGAAARHGVRLMMGRTADLAAVTALKPDAVILAGGATMLRPAQVPATVQDLRSVATATLADPAKKTGTAVIFDQDHTAMTYAATLLLADRYDRVVLVTPRERLATDEPVVNRQGIYRRLSRRGVEIVTSFDLSPKSTFADGRIVLANVYSGAERIIADVALFTYATSRAPNDALAAPLRDRGIDVHVVGDCLAGRTVLTAVGEGHKAGNTV
jgi:thioredoxin reductase